MNTANRRCCIYSLPLLFDTKREREGAGFGIRRQLHHLLFRHLNYFFFTCVCIVCVLFFENVAIVSRSLSLSSLFSAHAFSPAKRWIQPYPVQPSFSVATCTRTCGIECSSPCVETNVRYVPFDYDLELVLVCFFKPNKNHIVLNVLLLNFGKNTGVD